MIHRSFLICLKMNDHTQGLKRMGGCNGGGEEVDKEQSRSLRDERESTGDEYALEQPSKMLCRKWESIFRRRKAVCFTIFLLLKHFIGFTLYLRSTLQSPMFL